MLLIYPKFELHQRKAHLPIPWSCLPPREDKPVPWPLECFFGLIFNFGGYICWHLCCSGFSFAWENHIVTRRFLDLILAAFMG